MKRIFALLTGIIVLLNSCKKDDSGNEFTNGITFGTSINYHEFTLTGEGTSFSTNPGTVAFRLESEEAFDGYSVKFIIMKDGSTYSNEVFSNNPTPQGHIFITAFIYNLPGSYSVTAYIVKPDGDKTIASGSFEMI